MTMMMRWMAGFGLAGLLLGACRAQQTRTIADPAWGMAGATVMLPAGWKFDGVMAHGDNCVVQIPDMRFVAQSPDGSVTLQHYPQIHYSYSSDAKMNQENAERGCLITQWFKPEEFLLKVAGPGLHPGSQYEVHAMPDTPELLRDRAEEQKHDAEMARHGVRQHTEVRKVGVAFSQDAGEACRVLHGRLCVQAKHFSVGDTGDGVRFE